MISENAVISTMPWCAFERSNRNQNYRSNEKLRGLSIRMHSWPFFWYSCSLIELKREKKGMPIYRVFQAKIILPLQCRDVSWKLLENRNILFINSFINVFEIIELYPHVWDIWNIINKSVQNLVRISIFCFMTRSQNIFCSM